jgi:hypothetical protein
VLSWRLYVLPVVHKLSSFFFLYFIETLCNRCWHILSDLNKFFQWLSKNLAIASYCYESLSFETIDS